MIPTSTMASEAGVATPATTAPTTPHDLDEAEIVARIGAIKRAYGTRMVLLGHHY